MEEPDEAPLDRVDVELPDGRLLILYSLLDE